MLRAARSLIVWLGVIAILTASCAHRRRGQLEPGTSAGPSSKGLPPGLPLPARPLALVHLSEPARALAALDPYLEPSLAPALVLRRELASVTTSELATSLARSVDAAAPWTVARLDPQHEIAYLPIRSNARAALARQLQSLPRVGKFGAVRLPSPPPSDSSHPWLAWFDAPTGQLTIARTVRGLASGAAIRKRYAGSPVVAVLGSQQLPDEVPFAAVQARGTVDDLTIVGPFRAGTDPFRRYALSPGALSGLLVDPQIVVGASTRWSASEAFVRDTMARVQREVSRQSFLVRGVLDELAASLSAVLRSWDGRVLAAVAGNGHARLAFGSADVGASQRHALRFIHQLATNSALLRNFTDDVPQLTAPKPLGKTGGVAIHAVTVSGVESHLPAPYRALLDSRKRLQIAIGWSPRAGAALVVAGPKAVAELRGWVTAAARGDEGSATTSDVAALAVAATPAQLRAALASGDANALARLWSIRPSGTRRYVVVRRDGPAGARVRLSSVPSSRHAPVRTAAMRATPSLPLPGTDRDRGATVSGPFR
ncbi:MAG: hypothetical protein B7733_15875 [Myxococcales bacterium FL481]|nr:MAG: hypothetical protein B7733_15875 [Myxococcales bacterium FL481]